MNVLRDELRKCLLGFEEREGRVRGRFLLPTSFTGFQGHFEGKPVLPGVCKIQAVAVLWEAWSGRALEIQQITMAKFMLPVEPGWEIAIEFGTTKQDLEQVDIKAVVRRDDAKVAEIHLKGIQRGPQACEL